MINNGEINLSIQPADRSLVADFFSRRPQRWNPITDPRMIALHMTTLAAIFGLIFLDGGQKPEPNPVIEGTPTPTAVSTITPRSLLDIYTPTPTIVPEG